LSHGLTVYAVEPNDNMRDYGVNNTKSLDVTWSDGVGEKTRLPHASVYAAFFGSSFNVVDQKKALKECSRIVRPVGWFACIWNPRDIEYSIRKTIEQNITSFIPKYDGKTHLCQAPYVCINFRVVVSGIGGRILSSW